MRITSPQRWERRRRGVEGFLLDVSIVPGRLRETGAATSQGGVGRPLAEFTVPESEGAM